MQQTMEQVFALWGLPKYIRVDNGKPFGDPQRSSIPELGLWLIGLGIEVVWNRPRSPKDNATVERMQSTTSRWTEVEKCSDCAELQAKLDKAAIVQRERYQVRRLGAKSRKEVYPELWHNSRVYSGKEGFDISRVGTYLSQVSFARKTNKKGAFNFYAQRVYVGRKYIHQSLNLRYDTDRHCFRLTDQDNAIIGYIPADNFSSENILSLNVCQNRYLVCQT
jgi:transposase InsO family protein